MISSATIWMPCEIRHHFTDSTSFQQFYVPRSPRLSTKSIADNVHKLQRKGHWKASKSDLKFQSKVWGLKTSKSEVGKNADESKIRRKPHAPPPACLELLIKKQLLRSTSTFVHNLHSYIHVQRTYNQRIFRFISTSRLTQVPRALRVSQLTFYALRVPTFLPGRVHRAKTWSLSKTTNNCPALSNVWQMDSVGR